LATTIIKSQEDFINYDCCDIFKNDGVYKMQTFIIAEILDNLYLGTYYNVFLVIIILKKKVYLNISG